MQEGYIKLYRCILDSSWSRQPDFVAVWIYCLLRANYNPADVVTRGGTMVHLEPGQFITSREQISIGTGVQESKVERILKVFKSEQQIEQQNKGKFRVISILNWQKYQAREQQIEHQMNNRRTTDEQQMNTNKKVKKEEEGKEKQLPTISQVSDLYRKYAGVNQVNGGQVVVFQDFIKIFSLEAIEESFQAAAASSIPVKAFLNWCKTRMERTRDAPAPAVADDDGEKQVAYLKSLGCI